ncbi:MULTISPECIES: hypothetical protein [Fischerella]|uniref:hypothetical protein n=1 Tax=Fischerella TaxID=1190 RepID=UPI0012F84389|nr:MULTISPECIES: hypothetical protein [Fischerella]MBD2430015.1 hypothetical protein [Fischerella sp. FACHB-380]
MYRRFKQRVCTTTNPTLTLSHYVSTGSSVAHGGLTGPHDRQGGASAVDGFPGIKHLALGIGG